MSPATVSEPVVDYRAAGRSEQVSAGARASVGIAERFERLPFSAYQRRLAIILAIYFAADVVDLIMLSFLLAPISHDLGLSAQQAGLAGSGVFAGAGVGAIVSGYLSDRFGRRQILFWTMLVWCVASLLTAFAWDLWSFTAFRFVTGIGLGAQLPAAFALVAELMPSNRRASTTGWMHVASQSAVVTFNLLSYAVIAHFGPAIGWRVMFMAMFFVGLFSLYVRRHLPESPRWYEARGESAKAEQGMLAFERAVAQALGRPLPPFVARTERPSIPTDRDKSAIATLFSRGYTGRTLFAWVLWFVVLLAYYAISVWVGKFLVDRGMSVSDSIGIGVLISAAGVPSAWCTGHAMERLGRRPVIVAVLLCVAVSAFVYSHAVTLPGVIAAGALMQFFLVATATTLYAYTPELFPTRARATGLGAAATIGRIAAVAGPLTIPLLVTRWGYSGAFVACAGCFVSAALLVLLFGPETRNRAIEQVSS